MSTLNVRGGIIAVSNELSGINILKSIINGQFAIWLMVAAVEEELQKILPYFVLYIETIFATNLHHSLWSVPHLGHAKEVLTAPVH